MKKTDAHLHYVDFNQESEGFETLLREMDKCQIESAVVFGLPVKKKWAYHEERKPGYYLDGYSACYYYTLTDEFLAHELGRLCKEDQARFAPLLCGFDPTDRGSVAYLEYMFDRYPFWKGIGELLLRHDELSLHTTGELPRVNHPCMDGVYAFCRKNDLPVLVHHNAQSVGYHDEPVYLKEVTDTLNDNPDLKFIWAHAGVSSRTDAAEGYVAELEKLVAHYPNLSIDLSWKVYDNYVLNENGNLQQRWRDLITRFPDRFMIGSDVTGHFERELRGTMERYDVLLESLPSEVSSQVASLNARAVYFRK